METTYLWCRSVVVVVVPMATISDGDEPRLCTVYLYIYKVYGEVC